MATEKTCECGYTQEMNDKTRKQNNKWRCYSCGTVNNYAVFFAALFVVGTFGFAYAEEVSLPLEQEYDDKWCVFLADGDHVKFTCNWKWFLPPYVMAEANQTEVPKTFSSMPDHNEKLAEFIKELLANPPAEEPPEPTADDIMRARIAEKRAENEAEREKLIGELAECRTGLGAFAAYQEQEAIEDYANKTRWEFGIRDNLSQNIQIGKILKAIEECDIMKTYAKLNLIGDYELNKYLADIADTDYLGRGSDHPLEPKVTDQSDASTLTDPVTEKDRADELDEMERIMEDLIERRVYEDPEAEYTGENRGSQPAGLKCQTGGQPHPLYGSAETVCPLDAYNAHVTANYDSLRYQDLLQLQCDNFLYIYQHKIGTDEFPVWLEHCVPKVVLGK